MKKRPLVSASLSDIREDAIVLTGSMSLVATALFNGSDRLMKFLQAKIPAAATTTDQRYRQWVFVLSKAGTMRVATRVASEQAEAEEIAGGLIFPRRLPSWRAHLRGDRAYLMHLSLLPPLLAALGDRERLQLIKDPSLRFDTRIPWEVTIERGEALTAVWRDAKAQEARLISLARESDMWKVTRDETAETCPEECSLASGAIWLTHFLPVGRAAQDPASPQ